MPDGSVFAGANVTIFHGTTRPAPLSPPDCDVRQMPWMPLDVVKLRKSKGWLAARRRPEVGFYMVNLWATAFHEVPAGSLENDDDTLAAAAMCSPDVWPEVRDLVLHGFILCSDGRLYHPVVAGKAVAAFEGAAKARARRATDNERLKRWRAERSGETPHETPKVQNETRFRTPDRPDETRRETPISALRLETEDRKKEKNSPHSPPQAGGEPPLKPENSAPPQAPQPSRRTRTASVERRDAAAAAETDPDFQRFWTYYPRKVAKPEAALSYAKAKAWCVANGYTVEDIFSAVVSQRADGSLDPRERWRFCPHPTTWLNQRRFTDEPVPDEGSAVA